MAPKANLKKFIACNKCKSTVLEQRKFARATLDSWTSGPVPFHTVETYFCTYCNIPVLTVEPKDPIVKSLIQDLVGPSVSLVSLVAIEVEIDLNVMQGTRTRTL